MNLISPEPMGESAQLNHIESEKASPLRACALRQKRFEAHPEAQEAGLCYHDAVVDTEPKPRIIVMSLPGRSHCQVVVRTARPWRRRSLRAPWT